MDAALQKSVRSLVLTLAALAVSLSTMACSGSDRPQTSDNGTEEGPATSTASADKSDDAPVDVCAEGDHVGCACDNEGASFDCGRVKRQVGTYESCAEGTSVCTNGIWGVCTATREVGPG